MKLTKFLRLRKAVEALDPAAIQKKLRTLDQTLLGDGLPFEPKNTAITQEGIFYIEPESGIATKVIAYLSDFAADLTPAQRSLLAPEGYTDHESINAFHPYHLLQCNTLAQSSRNGWNEPYRLSKRPDGRFYFRITALPDKKRKTPPEVYQVIPSQQLYVCSNCFLKVSSILAAEPGEDRLAFEPKSFFDVNLLLSWNSEGLLSKDYGFTKNMYPDDWLEICRVRKEQVHHRCESCYEELQDPRLKPYLFVHPTDHVEDTAGYLRLECLCIACIAELPAFTFVRERPELQEYLEARQALARRMNELRGPG